jgi:hypothetical protein
MGWDGKPHPLLALLKKSTMILHGRNLIIKADGVAIAAAKSCDINVHCEEIETSSPQTGTWRTAIIGRKSWSVTTNQMVTSILDPVQMVGVNVSLTINIANTGLPIQYILQASPTVELQSATQIDFVVWDDQAKRFLGCKDSLSILNRKYYNSWLGREPYTEAPIGSKFYIASTGDTYTLTANGLVEEKLTGQANVVAWKATGSIGNLAQGSFQFNGSGPLSPASLPST